MDLPPSQRGITAILILGLVIAVVAAVYFFVFFKPSINLPQTQVIQNPQKTLFLDLESPDNQTVAVDDSILIKGKTLPNSRVVLFNITDEEVLESDSEGRFMGKLQLDGGENTLTITAFSDSGEEKTLNVDILYNPKS